MWLRDFLPEHVPNARILTYGYNSTLLKNNSTASILEFSQNFLEALNTARAEDEVIETLSLRYLIAFAHESVIQRRLERS